MPMYAEWTEKLECSRLKTLNKLRSSMSAIEPAADDPEVACALEGLCFIATSLDNLCVRERPGVIWMWVVAPKRLQQHQHVLQDDELQTMVDAWCQLHDDYTSWYLINHSRRRKYEKDGGHFVASARWVSELALVRCYRCDEFGYEAMLAVAAVWSKHRWQCPFGTRDHPWEISYRWLLDSWDSASEIRRVFDYAREFELDPIYDRAYHPNHDFNMATRVAALRIYAGLKPYALAGFDPAHPTAEMTCLLDALSHGRCEQVAVPSAGVAGKREALQAAWEGYLSATGTPNDMEHLGLPFFRPEDGAAELEAWYAAAKVYSDAVQRAPLEEKRAHMLSVLPIVLAIAGQDGLDDEWCGMAHAALYWARILRPELEWELNGVVPVPVSADGTGGGSGVSAGCGKRSDGGTVVCDGGSEASGDGTEARLALRQREKQRHKRSQQRGCGGKCEARADECVCCGNGSSIQRSQSHTTRRQQQQGGRVVLGDISTSSRANGATTAAGGIGGKARVLSKLVNMVLDDEEVRLAGVRKGNCDTARPVSSTVLGEATLESIDNTDTRLKAGLGGERARAQDRELEENLTPSVTTSTTTGDGQSIACTTAASLPVEPGSCEQTEWLPFQMILHEWAYGETGTAGGPIRTDYESGGEHLQRWVDGVVGGGGVRLASLLRKSAGEDVGCEIVSSDVGQSGVCCESVHSESRSEELWRRVCSTCGVTCWSSDSSSIACSDSSSIAYS